MKYDDGFHWVGLKFYRFSDQLLIYELTVT